jgi:hypothetical protein
MDNRKKGGGAGGEDCKFGVAVETCGGGGSMGWEKAVWSGVSQGRAGPDRAGAGLGQGRAAPTHL